MSTPKWTEERTAQLLAFVGDETPVSNDTAASAALELGTTTRSIKAKLRKEGVEVEAAGQKPRRFSESQEATLRNFLESNSGSYTYEEIAANFEGGEFTSKEIQGKVLSMEATAHVKRAPQPTRTSMLTEDQEATFVEMASGGSFLEEIAEALGVEVARVRGKALAMLKKGAIAEIPKLRDRKESKPDAFDGLDVASLTVAELVEQTGKSARGIKTMLTRRALSAVDYDGAAKAAKAASN